MDRASHVCLATSSAVSLCNLFQVKCFIVLHVPGKYINLNPKQACHEVLALDRNIRFAGMANSTGSMMEHQYRADLKPLLSLDETNKSMLQAAIREGMRSTLEDKLGQCQYVLALYRKVKRITISLRPPTIKEGSRGILMISMDLSADHDAILLDKVLPFLEKSRIDL